MIELSNSDIFAVALPEFLTSELGGTYTPTQYTTAVQSFTDMVAAPLSSSLLDPTQFTTITTTSGNSVTTETNQLVGVESLRYMRGRRISFRATDLKPNTRMYAFFDDVPVDKYTIDSTGSSILTTDSSGIIEGFFDIPGATFNTGTKVFRLQDNQNNFADIPVGSLTSSAQAAYYTTGIRTSTQKTISTVTTQRTQREIQL